MLKFIDQTALCRTPEPKHRPLEKIDHIVIHRFDLRIAGADIRDAKAVAYCAQDTTPFAVGAYTGGRMPYHFVLFRENVYQGLKLTDIGAHAVNYNTRSVGIACLGDYRRVAPSPMLFHAAVELAAMLKHEFPTATVRGHDELPHGSTDPGKRCPGDSWSMAEFRRHVQFRLSQNTLPNAHLVGIVM